MPDSSITKKALAEAMKALMRTEPFSKISVGDICEKCRMNRKSFYYHFRDKYDLVNWIFHTELIEVIAQRGYENGWGLILDACRYFYTNRTFYAGALMIQGQNSFSDYFREVLEPVLLDYFCEIMDEPQAPGFFATFLTDAFIAAIRRWLTDPACMEPERFVALLHSCTLAMAQTVVRHAQEEPDWPPETIC